MVGNREKGSAFAKAVGEFTVTVAEREKSSPLESNRLNNRAEIPLEELVRGAELVFANAEQLFSEAELLRNNGYLNRALFLHQISMEECAKVDIVGAWATNLMLGHGVDIKKLTRSIRSHKAKNYANAYMSRVSDAEAIARERGDWSGSSEAFKRWQAEIHEFLNKHKNASLYVDFTGTTFVAPGDVIAEHMVRDFAVTNQYFLMITAPRLGALRRIATDTEALRSITTWFIDQIKEIEPGDQESLATLFQEMVDRYGEAKARQAGTE